MKNIITLDKLSMNKQAQIEQIECTGKLKRRLLDLGFIKGTTIVPILISPSKDPRAYAIRGSTIAIRKEDAKSIKVIVNG